jgi:ligand-binding sensor domain-containing protein
MFSLVGRSCRGMKTMMTKRCWVTLVAVVTGCAVSAFAAVGTWKNYTSMKDVKAMARSGANYWAATAGGLFRWDKENGEFEKLTNAEGLLSIDLTAIAIDANGDVWTGTSDGVLHVTSPVTGAVRAILDIKIKTDQSSKGIQSLAVMGDTLLVCTQFGLSVFRIARSEFGDTFSRFAAIPPSRTVSIKRALVFAGRIWAVIDDGTGYSIVSASLADPTLPDPGAWRQDILGSLSDTLFSLTAFNGKLYAGTKDGLYSTAGSSWQLEPAFTAQPVFATVASTTTLVVCSGSNVYTVDQTGTSSPFGGLLPARPTSVVIGDDGNPFVGTLEFGILQWQTSWTSHFPNGPNSNQFASVAVDPNGKIWCASGSAAGRGFYRLDGDEWKSFTAQNSPLPFDYVWKVSLGCDGSVWASTYGRGIVEVPPGADAVDSTKIYGANVGMVGVPNDQSFIVPSTVACDGQGNLWTSIVIPANSRVLAVRTPGGSWRTLPLLINGIPAGSLADPPVDRALAVDASDNLWTIVRTAGLKGVVCMGNRGRIDSVALFHITSANGLPSDDIRTIVIDKENDVWVGTDHGIAIITDPDNPTRTGAIAAYHPLDGQAINTIAVDALNQKWIGTSEGVILFSPDGTQPIATYTVENTGGKLIDNNVLSIAVDQQSGTVFCGTAFGLASLTTPAVAPKEAFDRLAVFPDPYVVPNRIPLTVDGLVENSTLKILTIDGQLVRDIRTPGGRIGFWDGTDSRGNLVASGIYLVVGFSEDGSQVGTGKVAVIRQ